MILLDTDICIELLHGNRMVLDCHAAAGQAAAVAGMTAGELYYGAEKSAKRQHNRSLVDQFLLTVPIIHTTVPILRTFGELKAALDRQGRPLPDADILIAATALNCCEYLVSGNVDHFQRFGRLSVKNWLR